MLHIIEILRNHQIRPFLSPRIVFGHLAASVFPYSPKIRVFGDLLHLEKNDLSLPWLAGRHGFQPG